MIVLLGLPGAGKGTQAARLAAALRIPHIATGDLIRTAIAAGGPHASLLQEVVQRGELVPDDLTLALLLDRLAAPDAFASVILDGYPRTRPQAETLDRELRRDGERSAQAVYLETDMAVLVERLAGRRICSAAGHPYHVTAQRPRIPGWCDIDGSSLIPRSDDQPHIIRHRLTLQSAGLAEVVDFYRAQGHLHVVDGGRSVLEVAATVGSVIDPKDPGLDWIAPNRGWIIGRLVEPGGAVLDE